MTTPDLRSTLLATNLERLGFRPDDAAEFRRTAEGLTSRPDLVARIETISTQVRARIGDFEAGDAAVGVNDPTHVGLTHFEHGLLVLMALVSVADEVHAELRRRGVPEDHAWKSLSDLGQQAHIHRVVHGSFGLSSQSWCAANYTGRHLWLGRLQFTLDRDEADGGSGYVLGVHIPEAGPLTPEAVDESLALARAVALPAYQDYAPHALRLHSWLLDPGVCSRLNPDSNFVRFARRFTLDGESEDGYRDALFFGFHIEPDGQDVDLNALPQATSLQRAIVAQLRSDGVRLHTGTLTDWPGAYH